MEKSCFQIPVKSEAFWEIVIQQISGERKSGDEPHTNINHASQKDIDTDIVKKLKLFHPSGKCRVTWEIIVVLLILVSVTIEPFNLAFNSDGRDTSPAFELSIAFIFCVDVLVNMNSAFIDLNTDLMVTDRIVILKNYASFWLWVDVISAIPYTLIIMRYESRNINSLTNIRLVRITRLLKLWKIYKLFKAKKEVQDFLEKCNISPHFTGSILLLLQVSVLSHLIACFWFFLTTPLATGVINLPDKLLYHTWANSYGLDTGKPFDQYFSSLYWTFTTLFTVGYGDIKAANIGEQLFSIATMLTGTAVLGGIVVKMTSVLESINLEQKETKVKMGEFREYLVERKIPPPLFLVAKVLFLFPNCVLKKRHYCIYEGYQFFFICFYYYT
jgi:hypothetical protein